LEPRRFRIDDGTGYSSCTPSADMAPHGTGLPIVLRPDGQMPRPQCPIRLRHARQGKCQHGGQLGTVQG
jgi:hypothetical protein